MNRVNKHGFVLDSDYTPDHIIAGMSLSEYNKEIMFLCPEKYFDKNIELFKKYKEYLLSQQIVSEYNPDLTTRINYTQRCIERNELKLKYILQGG